MDGAQLIEIDLHIAEGRAAVVLGIHGRRIVVSAQSTSPAAPTQLAEDQFVSLLTQLSTQPDADQPAAADGDQPAPSSSSGASLLHQALTLVVNATKCDAFTHATRPRRKQHDTSSPAHDDELLHAALYPSTHYFVLHTPSPATAFSSPRIDRDTAPASSHLGAVHMGPPRDDPAAARDASYPDFKPDPALARYSTRDVVVLRRYAGDGLYDGVGAGAVFRVLVGPGAQHQQHHKPSGPRKAGVRVAVCKAYAAGLLNEELRQELACLQRVEKMRVDEATAAPVVVRVPKLEGYVVHAETGHIVGFLHGWIAGATLEARLDEMDRRGAHFASTVAEEKERGRKGGKEEEAAAERDGANETGEGEGKGTGKGKEKETKNNNNNNNKVNGFKDHQAEAEEREKAREKELRARWAAQIQETVGKLHKMGVVWGGAEPDNVLIDEHDNAWVIDLSGDGGAPGQWVSAAATGSSAFEADDEAVRDMVEGELLVATADKLKTA